MAVPNSTYDKILQEYKDRQRQRDYLIRDRREYLYRRDPAFAEIDTKIREMSLASFDEPLPGLHDRIGMLVHRRSQLLSAYGLGEDFLSPPYVCMRCKDSGFVDGQPCLCFRQKLLNARFSQNTVMASLPERAFDAFELSRYSRSFIDRSSGRSSYDAAASALATARLFVSGIAEGLRADEKHDQHIPSNLVLYGSTGIGKTLLSSCIARSVLDLGKTVVYLTAAQFFDLCSGHMFRSQGKSYRGGENGPPGGQDYDVMIQSDLLILDDLGTEIPSSFAGSALFTCVNERLLSGKATVISTNNTMEQFMERYTERVFSRISHRYVWLYLFGYDLRLEDAIPREQPHSS